MSSHFKTSNTEHSKQFNAQFFRTCPECGDCHSKKDDFRMIDGIEMCAHCQAIYNLNKQQTTHTYLLSFNAAPEGAAHKDMRQVEIKAHPATMAVLYSQLPIHARGLLRFSEDGVQFHVAEYSREFA